MLTECPTCSRIGTERSNPQGEARLDAGRIKGGELCPVHFPGGIKGVQYIFRRRPVRNQAMKKNLQKNTYSQLVKDITELYDYPRFASGTAHE